MKEIIEINRTKKDLYLIKYQIEFCKWFKKKTKIIKRLAIKEPGVSILPFRFVDGDNRLVYHEDGFLILEWMEKHDIKSFNAENEKEFEESK